MHDPEDILHDPEVMFTMFLNLIESGEDEEVNQLQEVSLNAMNEFYKRIKKEELSEDDIIKQLAMMMTATVLSVRHRALMELESH